MLIGQTIFLPSNTSTHLYYSPWFPGQADNGIFTYQRVHSTLTNNEVVTVVHKNAEEDGINGTALATLSAQLGATNLYEGSNGSTAVKELVRYVVELNGEGASPGELLHIRFLAPTWFATAET